MIAYLFFEDALTTANTDLADLEILLQIWDIYHRARREDLRTTTSSRSIRALKRAIAKGRRCAVRVPWELLLALATVRWQSWRVGKTVGCESYVALDRTRRGLGLRERERYLNGKKNKRE